MTKTEHRDPIPLTVRLSQLEGWKRNPRNIKDKKLQDLADSIKEHGQFESLVCWLKTLKDADPMKKFDPERDQKYIVGGGFMRHLAMTKILKWTPDHPVHIILNFPKSEAEKIAISLRANAQYGEYEEQALAELLYNHRTELDLRSINVDLGSAVNMEKFVDGFAPEGMDIDFIEDSGRRSITIICDSDEEMITLRKHLEIADQKMNIIKGSKVIEMILKGRFG